MQEVKILRHETGIGSLAVHENSLFVSMMNDVLVYDIRSLEKTSTFSHGTSEIMSSLVLGDLLFIGGIAPVHVIDIKTHKLIHELKGHTHYVKSLTGCGTTLFSGSSDNTIKIWDLNNWGLVNSLPNESNVFTMAIWNGQLASADPKEFVIKVWGTD